MLGVRAIVLGFRVRFRVRVRVRVGIRIRGLGDQNYEVGFETIGTVTKTMQTLIIYISAISREVRSQLHSWRFKGPQPQPLAR